MEALYRKYRPSTFADVVGQEHIERTLKNAIEQDKVSHAYLFCGPRGTGKTTTARILAKALMCEKGPTIEPDGTCPECQAIAQGTHPDVYELDAASRTGVENVREEIISRVSYAPTRGAWKVYIIDEVHMLSTAAFNALLKTIEEPPSHVVFILCTTDPQKVPETILSRCQRFDFHRISVESIVARLGAVCAKEGVEFEAEALDLIAHRAEGGMRNALTSLEQLIAYCGGKATLEGAQSLLGSLDNSDLSEIVEAIGRRDAPACFNWVAQYVETGADLAQFVHDLAEHVRTLYLLSMAGLDVELQISESTRTVMKEELNFFGSDRLSRMLIVLGDVTKELRISSNPRLSFEIALTRMIRPESDLTLEALAERIEELESRLAALSNGQASIAAPAPSLQVMPTQPCQAMPAPPSVPSRVPAPQPVGSAQGWSGAAQVSPSAQAASVAAPAVGMPSVGQAGLNAASGAPQSSARPVAQQPAEQAAAQPAGRPSAVASASRSVGSAQPQQPLVSDQAQQSFAPAPAPQAQRPSSAQASQPQPAAALTAQIDLSNPAAVQRLWHSVTASIRKVNPARGVLFMNAKVSAEANGQGIVVEFGKDSGFAFNAAQKPEVQELLAQTIQTVAGGTVPYRLALAGGASSVMQPAQPAVAPQANTSAPKNPYAAKAVAAVRAAQAAAQARPAAASAEAPSASAAYVPAQPYQSSGPSAQAANYAPRSNTVSSSAPQRSAYQPAAVAPASEPEPYDDQVPLDVYGASVSAEYDEDPYAQQYGAAASTSPAPTVQPASRAAFAQAPNASKDDGFSQESLSRNSAGVPGTPAAPTPNPVSTEGEADQIKSILTHSFGEGIKFEELPN